MVAALIGFGAMRTEMDRRGSKYRNEKKNDVMDQEMQISGVMSPPRNELQTNLLGDRL